VRNTWRTARENRVQNVTEVQFHSEDWENGDAVEVALHMLNTKQGMSIDQVRELLRYLATTDGALIPFSIYRVGVKPDRWAVDVVNEVSRGIATVEDFAQFARTWPGLQDEESYDPILQAQTGEDSSRLHWRDVARILELLAAHDPRFRLEAVYGWLPTGTYSVLVQTQESVVACDTMDELCLLLGCE
jgi:hypothetical protein